MIITIIIMLFWRQHKGATRSLI